MISSENYYDPTNPCPNVLKAIALANGLNGAVLHVLFMGTYTGHAPVRRLYLDLINSDTTYEELDSAQRRERHKISSLKTETAIAVQHGIRLVRATAHKDRVEKRSEAAEKERAKKRKAEEEEEDNRPLLGIQAGAEAAG